MSQENVALAHRWFEEVWNKKRLDAIDEMADPKAVGQGQTLHDGLINLEEFRAFASHLHSAFPDLRLAIEDTVAEDDRVVVRWKLDMTHSGSFLRYAATQKKVNVSGINNLADRERKDRGGMGQVGSAGTSGTDRGRTRAEPEAQSSGVIRGSVVMVPGSWLE